MLLYVQSKAFPHKTFVVLVKVTDAIARVRAQLLHILYELGREDHQFRLRYKGQYLRDAYTIEDYKIIDNAIVKMVPLSKQYNSSVDLNSLSTSELSNVDVGSGQEEHVKKALYKEVEAFNRREHICSNIQGLLYMHFMATCFCALTTYWYSFLWTGVVCIIGWLSAPTYTRLGGFMGKNSIYKYYFCIIYGTFALLNAFASGLLSALEWIRIINHGCPGLEFVGDCSHKVVFSAVFFGIQAIILLITDIMVWILFFNFKIQTGDSIERFLVQTRDIEKVLHAAQNGKLKDQRIAAFELATLASSGDDNKFRIVAEGGLEILISLSLSRDVGTQEHAVEAIAELLTVPSIQDKFVEIGGVTTLTPLLLSPEAKIVNETATALNYIVSDSEDNKHAVVAERGLDDLSHAAHKGNPGTQKIVAGIFLDLVYNTDIRAQVASRITPAKALIYLCTVNDEETIRFALQTLELLAIESADMICAQEELVDILLGIPMRTVDEKLYLLAGKILLYFTENKETCEMLIEKPKLREALKLYSRSINPVLQKITIKIILYMLEDKYMKSKARSLDMEEILRDIKENPSDRDAWDMADKASEMLNSDDHLTMLPTLSTIEKLRRMVPQEMATASGNSSGSQSSLTDKKDIKPFGSKSSLIEKKDFGSKASMKSMDRLSSASSLSDVKKGID